MHVFLCSKLTSSTASACAAVEVLCHVRGQHFIGFSLCVHTAQALRRSAQKICTTWYMTTPRTRSKHENAESVVATKHSPNKSRGTIFKRHFRAFRTWTTFVQFVSLLQKTRRSSVSRTDTSATCRQHFFRFVKKKPRLFFYFLEEDLEKKTTYGHRVASREGLLSRGK